jgi:ribonuclease III
VSNKFNLPKFRNEAFFHLAMTHRSYVNEHPENKQHNERLEFLGDAILNFLSGEFLYKRYTLKPEGELSSLRSALVDEKQLAQFASWLNLAQLLKLGKGAELEGGRQNANLLSSAFEALIGAYFLDVESNIDVVRAYVEPLFETVIDNLAIHTPQINYKSRFQEWALAQIGENPKYTILRESGPDHTKVFEVEVYVAGKKYGQGTGRSKQDAGKAAAKNALQILGII